MYLGEPCHANDGDNITIGTMLVGDDVFWWGVFGYFGVGGDDVFWWGVGGDVFGDDIFGGVWVVMTSELFVSDVTVAPFPLSDLFSHFLFLLFL